MTENDEKSTDCSEEQGGDSAEKRSTAGDRAKMYQMATELLRATLDGQTESLQNFNNKSIDIIRFNQVVIGVIVTAFALVPGLEVNLYLIASLLSFLVSLWFCILVYSPENRPGGIRLTTDILESIKDITHFHEETIETYNTMIRGNRDVIARKNSRFRAGLWSTFAGVLYFVIAILRSIAGTPPQIIAELPIPLVVDSVTLVLVAAVTLIGWYTIRKKN